MNMRYNIIDIVDNQAKSNQSTSRFEHSNPDLYRILVIEDAFIHSITGYQLAPGNKQS